MALAVGAASLGFVLTAAQPLGASDPIIEVLSQPGDAEHGKLVFTAGDCGSCHASPGQKDRLRLGGGMALASPYGTFRPPNISPDLKDGIGGWTAIDLGNALLRGVSPSGEHYYPALPYPAYAHMKAEDVRDLMAYIRTLPVVKGRPPPHDLSFPFTVRRGVGIWKLLFLNTDPIELDPLKSAAWNRGHYLVEAVAHCAECHSKRNIFGALKASSRYAGARNPEGVGFAPNITPARLGHWTVNDFAMALKTGVTPEGRRLGAAMADVVTNLSSIPDADREAIAVYMKTLPPRPTPSP